MQRLYIAAPLAEESSITAPPEAAHYLNNVLRLKAGDEILVFNGQDGEWRASIEPEGKKRLKLKISTQERPQPEPASLIYCFAPLKQGRLDYMIQKATEMGAGIIQPVITQHTQMHKLNIDRVLANAIEAAEQCGVLSIPQCRETTKFDKFINDWDKTIPLIFCDESNEGNNPLPLLQKIKHEAHKKIGLIIGPEGGFSEQERTVLHKLPFVTSIPLGPRILRADTAAVAAITAVQMVLGDWDTV